MERIQDVKPLDGTLDVVVAEDGQPVAHITALAQSRLAGAFITLRTAQAASRIAVGLALYGMGVSVLLAEGHLKPGEGEDLYNEVTELVKANQSDWPEPSDDDIPF